MIYALKTYGEEKFAKKIVRAIIQHREEKGPIKKTLELSELIKVTVPKRDLKKNPATKTFQALRILVNKEIEELENALPLVFSYLKPQARLVVISFHSLEDRMVKRFIRRQEQGRPIPRGMPILDTDLGKTMIKMSKAIKPKANEVVGNRRARSAVLRIAERIVGERD